ncbi:MAG: ATP synthase F1 subunit epsilon [Acidimicrobiales bacterium]
MTLQVELVSPERILYSGEADMVIARTIGGGEIAFLTGHAPFLGALDIALVTIRSSLGDELVAVHGGFVEVSSGNEPDDGEPPTKVTILSDLAELAGQIDVDRARHAKDRAEAALRESDDDHQRTAAKRADVRLQAANAA